MPTLSVVLPVYNGEAFITEALEAILAQSPQPEEIIVMDDESTDSTPEKVRAVGSDRIRYQRNAHKGLAMGRLAGMRLAKGDLIAFCDADDVWLPGKIQKQLAALDGYDIVHTDAFLLKDGKRIGRYWERQGWRPVRGGKEVLPAFVDHNQVSASTVMFRRSAFDRIGDLRPDPSVWMDIDYSLWLRLLETGARITFVDEPLIHYRLHDNQLTKKAHAMSRWEDRELRDFLKRNPSFSADHPLLTRKKLLKTYLKLRFTATDADRTNIPPLTTAVRSVLLGQP